MSYSFKKKKKKRKIINCKSKNNIIMGIWLLNKMYMYPYMDNVDCRHSRDLGNGCLPCFWWWLYTRRWRRFWTPCLQWCAPLHGWLCTSLHVRLECGSFFLILLNEMINCTWHTDIGILRSTVHVEIFAPFHFHPFHPLCQWANSNVSNYLSWNMSTLIVRI